MNITAALAQISGNFPEAAAVIRERVTELEGIISATETEVGFAQRKLRSAQINWQEQCLFDADDAMTTALKTLSTITGVLE